MKFCSCGRPISLNKATCLQCMAEALQVSLRNEGDDYDLEFLKRQLQTVN